MSAGGRATARVLVIDDELGFRELLSVELGARGHEVVTAADGAEGLAKVKAGGIDVVVSDLTMPRQGGAQTLRAIKEADPSIEVIMATGYATLESAVECMRRGAYDFITKPFQPDDLARLVARAAEKRRLSRKVGELEEIRREMRTPLNSILGYTSLQLDRVYGPLTGQQEEALRRVESAAKALLRVLDGAGEAAGVAVG